MVRSSTDIEKKVQSLPTTTMAIEKSHKEYLRENDKYPPIVQEIYEDRDAKILKFADEKTVMYRGKNINDSASKWKDDIHSYML